MRYLLPNNGVPIVLKGKEPSEINLKKSVDEFTSLVGQTKRFT